MATPSQEYYTDYLDDFRNGVDSNIPPRSLPLQTLPFGLNISLRGRFARTRPPFRFINIIDPSGVLPALGGLFQGACYYRPDAAPESLFMAVSGRLFQLTPDNIGNAVIKEWTIPGDPNDAHVPQSWLWQAENFLIVNDGINLPVFFDGTTTRRSLGNSIKTLATLSAPAVAPALNANVTVDITAPYNGPIGVPVQMGADTYTTISAGTASTSAYNGTAVQTSNNLNSGNTSGLFRKPSAFFAYSLSTYAGTQPWPLYTKPWPPANSQLPIDQSFIRPLQISRPFTGALYSTLYLNCASVTLPVKVPVGVASISPDGMTLGLVRLQNFSNLNIGVTSTIQGAVNITWSNQTIPSSGFPIPGFGNTANFTGAVNYTGSVGDYLYIGSNQFMVEFHLTSYAQSVTTTFTLTLANVNATPGNNYGAGTNITVSANELPAGRMGTYGQGRVWMSLTDGISFIGGDLVGSSSGTAQYNFRDAVLHVTQNVTLAGGVNFRIPSSADTIRAMVFTNTLDVSLGQGPLLVFTDLGIFSCQAPVDSTTWATLQNPILTEPLKGAGGKSQNAVVLTNADIIFRSDTVNIRSLLLARMDYNQWGNTPISNELIRFLKDDDQTLLTFSSGINFDNRMLMTARPTPTQQGIYHQGIVALNFDSITSLQGKAPSIWEGIWTGLQVFQLLEGTFSLVDRAFAFVIDNPCQAIQLYELLPEVTTSIYDVSDFGPSPTTFGLETSDLFRGNDNSDIRQFKALEDGELAIDNVLGILNVQAFYKADQSPEWIPWRTFNVHVDETAPNAQPGYFPRVPLGKPDETETNDGFSSRNARFGYTFQVKLLISGHCRILGGRFRASPQPEPEFSTPSST